ncbi:MAG: chromate transporter [Lachnospiraceae bacterium]
MIYFTLFYEFFKIGLFSVGGGMATLPFLMDLTNKYDWYTASELTNMIAISESTPGPVGINMSTYAGYQAAGIAGAIVSTCSMVVAPILIILIVARFMEKFYNNPSVQAIFYGVRPAVAAAIGFAVWGLIEITLFAMDEAGYHPDWLAIGLCVTIFLLLQIKKLQKLHPLWWMVAGAIIGVALKL